MKELKIETESEKCTFRDLINALYKLSSEYDFSNTALCIEDETKHAFPLTRIDNDLDDIILISDINASIGSIITPQLLIKLHETTKNDDELLSYLNQSGFFGVITGNGIHDIILFDTDVSIKVYEIEEMDIKLLTIKGIKGE